MSTEPGMMTYRQAREAMESILARDQEALARLLKGPNPYLAPLQDRLRKDLAKWPTNPNLPPLTTLGSRRP